MSWVEMTYRGKPQSRFLHSFAWSSILRSNNLQLWWPAKIQNNFVQHTSTDFKRKIDDQSFRPCALRSWSLLTWQVPTLGIVELGRNTGCSKGTVDLPRIQRNWPVETSRLQVTHSSDRATGVNVNNTPTTITLSTEREEHIWLTDPRYEATNSSHRRAVSARTPTAEANHWSFKWRTKFSELLTH